MGQVILICSGKGGTGKTGISAALSIALAKKNKRVLAIDGAVGYRNLDIVLGLENRVVNNLIDVLENKCSLEQASVSDRRFPELTLLPNAWMRSPSSLNADAFKTFIAGVRDRYDLIIIDCPENEELFRAYMACADRAVVVITPDVCCIRNADKTIRTMKNNGLRDISLIVNRYNSKLISTGINLSLEDIGDLIAETIIGIIPESRAMMEGINRGESVSLGSSPVGNIINLIADRLLGSIIALTPVKKLGRIK